MAAPNKLYIMSFLLVILFSVSLSPVYSQTASFKEVLIDVGYARFVTHVWAAESEGG